MRYGLGFALLLFGACAWSASVDLLERYPTNLTEGDTDGRRARAWEFAECDRGVLAPGGPVAFIGATGASHAAIGYLAAKGAVGMMNEIPPQTAGEWFLGIQRAIATETMSRPLFYLFDKFDVSDGEHTLLERREHLEMWMLVGDPATRIY